MGRACVMKVTLGFLVWLPPPRQHQLLSSLVPETAPDHLMGNAQMELAYATNRGREKIVLLMERLANLN